jgi:hypothetical protein
MSATIVNLTTPSTTRVSSMAQAPRSTEVRGPLLGPVEPSTTGFAALIEAPLNRTLVQETEFRQLMSAASSGDRMSQREALLMQAQVYQYSQHVEVTTRVVDRSVGALKQLLSTPL